MNYTIRQRPDVLFWDELSNVPARAERSMQVLILEFGRATLKYVPADILKTWEADLAYTVPATPTPITDITYLITKPSVKTSNCRRIFAMMTYPTSKGRLEGFLFEVTAYQFVFPAQKLRTPDGVEFNAPSSSLIYKGDIAPVRIYLSDSRNGCSLLLEEQAPKELDGLVHPLRIEMSDPLMSSVRINEATDVMYSLGLH